MSSLYTLRWGILGCGGISAKFVKDLVLPPKTREVFDVAHEIVAVGSRDASKSQAWAKENIPSVPNVKVYGSYDELVADPNVDVIYIGTPHTFHYIHGMLALRAGKHVLCEKPVTSNAAELRAMLKEAKERKLFFMEAMWTRFQPLALAVVELIQSKSLGDVRMLQADLSGDFDIENIPTSHRILAPELGGGALLDLGPYPLVWAIIALYENPSNLAAVPHKVTGSMIKTPITGVDSSTVFVLEFANLQAHAVLSVGITTNSPDPSVIIRFQHGTITLSGPPYRPTLLTVQYFDTSKPGSSTVVREEKRSYPYEGGGWQFQADEVARRVRAGETESKVWGHDKSLLAMEVFDKVREQGGYVFPPGVEQVV